MASLPNPFTLRSSVALVQTVRDEAFALRDIEEVVRLVADEALVRVVKAQLAFGPPRFDVDADEAATATHIRVEVHPATAQRREAARAHEEAREARELARRVEPVE